LNGRLAELRLRSDLTQRRLSELSGVNPQTISEIERGIANPTLSTLEALARALKVELAELVATPAEEATA
jgi:transcriptional regulator with XRE-family HTH domain